MNKIFSVILFLFCFAAFSQSENYNSQQLEILHLVDSGKQFSWSSPDFALSLSEKSLIKSKEINFIEGIIYSLKLQSTCYYIKGLSEKALKTGIEAIRISEENNNYKSIASTANTIGLIYQDMGKYERSIGYFEIAIKYGKQNKKAIDTPINNKANSLYYLKKYTLSIKLHKQALKYRQEQQDTSGIADCQNDIGIVYIALNQFEKAREYILACNSTKEAIHDTEGIAFSSLDMANLYIEWEKPEKSIGYINRAYQMAKLMNSPRYKEMSYSLYAKAYNLMKEFDKAYKYQLLFSDLRDSLRSNESIKQIAEMQTKYNTEKTEQALELKNVQYEKGRLETKKRTLQRNFTFVGLLLVIILIIFVLRSYRIKRKANIILESQKKEISEKNEELNQQNEEITAQRDQIEHQKEIVEEIHHELSQSIDYATRLQGAILPEAKILTKYLSEHFVLFKPKDKVSGDFYWWANVENHTVITAADSTGHGVPGAFMSMLGASFLREIVQKEYITHTGVILRKLRKEIIKSLKQKGEIGEQKDGMDMAIVSINHENNLVQFSGANNPLYIITANERSLEGFEPLDDFKNFYEIKADKMPIAIYDKMDAFTTYEFLLEKGDQIYMFSDGYADQFGGPKGKKFKYKPFKRMLFENSGKPMIEQKEILNKTFVDWQGKLEQIDDVIVLGIKI